MKKIGNGKNQGGSERTILYGTQQAHFVGSYPLKQQISEVCSAKWCGATCKWLEVINFVDLYIIVYNPVTVHTKKKLKNVNSTTQISSDTGQKLNFENNKILNLYKFAC